VSQTTWQLLLSLTKVLQSTGAQTKTYTAALKRGNRDVNCCLLGKIDKEEVKCKHLLYWSGERGIKLLNSWDLSVEQHKKLGNY